MSLEIGKLAEAKVQEYLIKRGYRIIAKNISYPFGELDIIAEQNGVLVFVEVKYRQSRQSGFHFEAVNLSKQKKIIKAAQCYLQKCKGEIPSCRFDVVGVWGTFDSLVIDHIIDAFWIQEY